MTRDELRQSLNGLTLEQTIRFWIEVEAAYPDQAVRWLCLADRYYLLVRACRRIDAVHPWIYERCREVEANPDGCIDLWAREHYKSTLITFAGTLQEILRDPEITIGIFSHTRPIARKFWSQLKLELEGNDILKRAFPDILYQEPARESPRWSEEKGLAVKRQSNAKEGTLEAWGLVDGQPTSAHFALMIFDDVVTRESVTTPEQITKTTAAWELADNLGQAGGRKWHIGTRYSFADTYQSILERGSVVPRIHPATDDGTMDGKPVLWTKEVWEQKKRDQGEATVACQLLQNPIAGQQAMFKTEWLKYYEVRPSTLNIYIMIDPARSTKPDSANTAISVVGVDGARNKYLIDGYRHKMALSERWQRMRDLRTHWLSQPGVQQVYVGYEKFGAQSDMDYFVERMQTEKVSFEIVELEWPRDRAVKSKEDRVQRLEPDFKNGRFWLPTRSKDITKDQQRMIDSGNGYRCAKQIRRKDNEGNIYDLVTDFIHEYTLFPFGGKRDLIDAASRIYDMDAVAPMIISESELEPECFADT